MTTWNIWLLNADNPPLLWMGNLNDKQAMLWSSRAAAKVTDGSDADAFVMLRSDMQPDEINVRMY